MNAITMPMERPITFHTEIMIVGLRSMFIS